jgi:two-component system, NtrC family, sensor kinase
LSQVYGFAQQSKGTITVSSEVGVGTTFRLSLPVCAEKPKAKPAELIDTGLKNIEPATVLLVEDHPDVSLVARDYLEQYGCKVIEANSAERAVETLNGRHDIDLVLSDIVMPGMSGLELGRLVREHHPEIPVILASGYSDKAAVATSEGFALIRKPYSPETLSQVLAQILGDEVDKIKAG